MARTVAKAKSSSQSRLPRVVGTAVRKATKAAKVAEVAAKKAAKAAKAKAKEAAKAAKKPKEAPPESISKSRKVSDVLKEGI